MDVRGQWSFTGAMTYSAELSCGDTLTMRLDQHGTTLTAETNDWHFWCAEAQSDTAIPLRATGAVRGDSLSLRWTTPETNPYCPKCWAFTTDGHVGGDSMAGRYFDFLGGSGTWRARRQT
jgi:hypothetical protein